MEVNNRICGDTPLSELMHALPSSEDELYHWKYIKREKIKGKWRYYYDEPKAKKDAKKAASDLRDTVKSISDKFSSFFNQSSKTAKNDEKSVLDTVKDTVHKYVEKIPDGDTYRYFYSDEAYKSYMKGKDAVDKASDKEVGVTVMDTFKYNVDNFLSNVLSSGFGQAVYNAVLPAFTALQIAKDSIKSFSELKKSKKEQTSDDHQDAINPDYDSSTYDYSMNCAFCTAAYDLRKRGYDVEANPISALEGYTVEDICNWYDGATIIKESEVQAEHTWEESPGNKMTLARDQALAKTLESYGDGARGHLCLYWTNGGGHDIIWEVENGEVVYRDCQTNQIIEISNYFNYASSYEFIRVDNCEPNEAVLRTVRNRN